MHCKAPGLFEIPYHLIGSQGKLYRTYTDSTLQMVKRISDLMNYLLLMRSQVCTDRKYIKLTTLYRQKKSSLNSEKALKEFKNFLNYQIQIRLDIFYVKNYNQGTFFCFEVLNLLLPFILWFNLHNLEFTYCTLV